MALSIGVTTSIGSSGAVTSITTSGINTQATGSIIVAGLSFDLANTFSSFTDSNNNNTWTQILTEQSDANGKFRMYYVQNAIGGTGHTFTLTTTGSGAKSIFVVEIIGGATSNSLDQSAVVADATSPYDSPAITTTVANTCMVAFCASDVVSGNPITHTPGNGFTKQTEVTNANTSWVGALGTLIVSATGTYNSTWTISGGTVTTSLQFIAAFKAPAAAGGFLTRNYWWDSY